MDLLIGTILNEFVKCRIINIHSFSSCVPIVRTAVSIQDWFCANSSTNHSEMMIEITELQNKLVRRSFDVVDVLFPRRGLITCIDVHQVSTLPLLDPSQLMQTRDALQLQRPEAFMKKTKIHTHMVILLST